jgi:uncharacterized phage protein (TIGR02218 family)
MRNFSPLVKSMINQGARFAFGYEIELENGQKTYLTNFSRAILINGITYLPDASLQITKANFNDSAADLIEIKGILDKTAISLLHNIVNAKISLSIILIDKALIEGFLTLRCFSAHKENLQFTLYLKNNTARLTKSVTKFYSKTCRATFGDSKCGIDIENFAAIKDIYGISNNIVTLDTGKESGYYDYGRVNFLGTGIYMLILKDNASSLILQGRVTNEGRNSKQVKIFPGCDKTYEICYNKFQNVLNFRGEPFIT